MMAFNSLPVLELPDRRSVARIILASGGDINCGQDAIYGSGAGPGIRQIVMMQPHVCCVLCWEPGQAIYCVPILGLELSC